MYGWGSSTNNWKKPGYKYDDARKPYLDKLAADSSASGPRNYMISRAPNLGEVNPLGKSITSNSQNPIIIAVDVTGSMAQAPGEFFDRAPLIWQTLSQYRPDMEICFAAIGDANGDQWPLQVIDFTKEIALEQRIKALGCEGGGGGTLSESYELFGYFMLNHCTAPNATTPYLFIYGDEKFYNQVHPGQVEGIIGDELQGPLDSMGLWKGLIQKFNVFFIQKPYGNGNHPEIDAKVHELWANALGDQRIIQSLGMERAADQIMGIIAKQWGQYGDFMANISSRQDKEVVEQVDNSLKFIDGKPSGDSVRPKVDANTPKTKPLVG